MASGDFIGVDKLVFPYSPAEFPAPPVYEFRIYHLLRVDNPCEPFRTRWETL
jgi:hypothetical protein